MAIYDYLPTFNYIEPNNLKGLQPGFVVAQMEVASAAEASLLVTKGTTKFMENGTICDISAAGICAPSVNSKNLFICFSEPLKTLFDADKFFAVEVAVENPRLVQLMPGDEWMGTKNLDVASHVVEGVETNPLYGRIVKVTNTSGMSNDDWFKCTKMADGTTGYHYMYLG